MKGIIQFRHSREGGNPEHLAVLSMDWTAAFAGMTIIICHLALSSLSYAAFTSGDKGTATAGFLKHGAGARAAALGEAYSALVDDASALYWNPAALTKVQGQSVIFMHAVHLQSSFFDYAAYARDLGSQGVWALSLQYQSAGSIEETDDTGTTTGNFSPNDLAATIGFGRRFEGLSVGASAKLIQSKIVTTARAVAMDLGILYPNIFKDRVTLSLAASNLGGSMKFDRRKEDLPLAIRLGLAGRLSQEYAATFEYVLPQDNRAYQALGLEKISHLQNGWTLAGRVGLNLRSLDDLGGLAHVSAGFGLGWQSLQWDYALVPFGDLGLTHRISLSLKF